MLVSVITPVQAMREEHVQWLGEAIQSVQAQTHKDWEMLIVNDRSKLKFSDYPKLVDLLNSDERIKGMRTQEHGVSGARNTGAAAASGGVLLPLDADDLFTPEAMEIQLEEMAKEKEGFVYGHIQIRQNNSQRLFKAKPYSFRSLLTGLQMPVGSMHFKSDWEKVGGWNPKMNEGLEDWEYWLALGELGVCGRPVDAITYIYRRHPYSRLSNLRTTGAYEKSYARMRELHPEVFRGSMPVGCCVGGGGGGKPHMPKPQAQVATHAAMQVNQAMIAVSNDMLVKVEYVGDMRGEWGVNGKTSRLHYDIALVEGRRMLVLPDGRVGVDPRDLSSILRQDRGRSFKAVP